MAACPARCHGKVLPCMTPGSAANMTAEHAALIGCGAKCFSLQSLMTSMLSLALDLESTCLQLLAECAGTLL
jgi:hypothetical protein